jgi:signal transduction histidine kinase
VRLSIKSKQVAGVTSIVGVAVIVLSGFYLSSLAQIRLEESEAGGELLANAIFQRAQEVVASGRDPQSALQADAGLQSILESSAYPKSVIYAAIADVAGLAIVHSDPTRVGHLLPLNAELSALLERGALSQIRAIYAEGGRTLDVRKVLLIGNVEFGSIRVGVSTLLIRSDLDRSLRPALLVALSALAGSSLVATLLAQLLLRPIHVIRSGLTRLGQGEFGVVVNVPQQDELGELGEFFNAASARLSADREAAGQQALESVVDRLEDAVAIFNLEGDLQFANAAMRATLPHDPLTQRVDTLLPPGHPYRTAIEDTLASRQSRAPLAALVPKTESDGSGNDAQERLILTHAIEGRDGHLVGVMLVVRNLDYLSQVQSTITYSRKLAALSRLSAGVAHEVKNPLNATVIHLELLKQQVTGRDLPVALEHLSVISAQMRRLDEVVQGFLKFIRPQELRLQPVSLASLVEELMPIVSAEAQKAGVTVTIDIPATLPDISADRGMLGQALLNLALNACQAMPDGGRLRIAGAVAPGRRIEVVCEDTGVGISPEHLSRIFDLYFTTKESGSGIGLSLVYRTIQLHDGEIEVQSSPGGGTNFRLLLLQA